jgi:small-conductance mechanosensitive channel
LNEPMAEADWIELVGPNHAVAILGVKLVGANAENFKKLLFTLAFFAIVLALVRLLRLLIRKVVRRTGHERALFWARQGVNLFGAIVLLFGVISIWFDDPTRLTTALGLVTAGLAFALQRVITAIAGYIVILRGKTFSVGDRIVMGGVRGDVIALDFMQTTIMEMGQPPPVQNDEPAMWVQSRQYTGRIVTVSNARIFDEPVYNYTREFPFIWEELRVPVPYGSDHEHAERILLEVAKRHSVPVNELSAAALAEMRRRYVMEHPAVEPRVYMRLTDNWIELTVRFVARDHGVREAKDRISRDLLDELERARIPVASATLQIVASVAPRADKPAQGASA